MNPILRRCYVSLPLNAGDATIPVGLTEEDFQLLLDTLLLWKKKLVLLVAVSTEEPK